MARKPSGRDAAVMKPALIPDAELRARDNSGGRDYDPYAAEFGDGGYIIGGPKPHLTTRADGEGDEDGHYETSERKKGRAGRNDGGSAR